MRKVVFPVAFIGASTLVACSFQLRAGSGANQPASTAQPAATAPGATTPAATTTATTPQRTGPIIGLGKRKPGSPTGPSPTPTSTATTTATSTAPVPAPTGAPVVTGTTVFGSGTVDPTGFKGNLYWIEANTTKLPALASLQPVGFLFTKELNIAPQAFTGGFPGVDTARTQNFAIRYEAPLVVSEAADFDFRLVADDGAILQIDGMTIVDNDGVKTAASDKTGPVHLVAGTHLLTVDYFQTSGNVALQVFCTKANGTETVCPTQL